MPKLTKKIVMVPMTSLLMTGASIENDLAINFTLKQTTASLKVPNLASKAPTSITNNSASPLKYMPYIYPLVWFKKT